MSRFTKSDLLESVRTRSGSRLGISTADSYLTALDSCFSGGLCPSHMKSVSGDQWAKVLKEAEQKLTYCAPGMNIKSNNESSTPGFLLDFNCIISTNRKDRDGDILLPEGATLDPMAPLLWQHNPLFPIGKVFGRTSQSGDRQKIAGRCGIAKFDHDSELADMSRDAATLVQCNALRISHGFDPKSFKPLDQDDGRWLVSSYEILEVSLVSIPSNVGAVIESFSRGKLHSPIIKGWAKSKFDARPVQGRGVTFEQPHICTCGAHSQNDKGASIVATEVKAMQSETTQEVNEEQTPAPSHDNDRLRGEGPQQGDHDFAERYASERVEQQPVDHHPGTASTNPLGSDLNDAAGKIATGASGERNPQNSKPVTDQDAAEVQTIATGGGGKSLKDVNDSMGVQSLATDSAAHHSTLENVDTHVDVDVPGVKAVAMRIKHSGKAGQVFLHKSMGAVHHVGHHDDFTPDHIADYHQPDEIEKMYKCVAGVKSVKVSYSHPEKEYGYDMIHRPSTNPDSDKGKIPANIKAGRMLSQKNVSRLTEAAGHLIHVHGMPVEHASNQAKALCKAAHSHIAEMLKENEMGDEPAEKGNELADSTMGPDMYSVGDSGRPPVEVSFEVNALKCLLSLDSCKDWELAVELADTITRAKKEFDLEVELRNELTTTGDLGSEEQLRAILMRELTGTVAE